MSTVEIATNYQNLLTKMETKMKKIMAFLKDEDGLELSEYAVMGSLIILALIIAITGLSGAIGDAFDRLTAEITPPA